MFPNKLAPVLVIGTASLKSPWGNPVLKWEGRSPPAALDTNQVSVQWRPPADTGGVWSGDSHPGDGGGGGGLHSAAFAPLLDTCCCVCMLWPFLRGSSSRHFCLVTVGRGHESCMMLPPVQVRLGRTNLSRWVPTSPGVVASPLDRGCLGTL